MTALFPMLRALAADFWRQLGWHVPLVAVTTAISDLLEGVGLALLLPLLSRFSSGQSSQTGMLARWTTDGLSSLGLDGSLENLLGAIFVAVVFQHGFYMGSSWLLARCKSQYMTAWRGRLFTKVFDARWHFFTARKSGGIANTILEDTKSLGQLFHESARIFDSLILVFVYLAVSLASAWQVALVIVAFGGLMFFVTSPILRRGLRNGVAMREKGDTLSSVVVEFLAGAKLIKSTASEKRAEETFNKSASLYSRLFETGTFHANVIRSIYELVAVSLLVICLWAGVEEFKIDFGSIVLSIFVFLRIYQRLSLIQQSAQTFQTHRPAFDAVRRLYRDAEAEAEVQTAVAAGHDLPQDAGGIHIALRDVRVNYGDHAALAGATLDLPAGSIVGIAGPSGAGKSTLVDCILGLAPVDSGAVAIDGRSLAEISLRHWRRSVGYVAQETFLFNTSIRENIRWAHPNATDAEVERAARRAHAEDFIGALPRGFDTEVGERGVRLSGGQRQRIGLARALVSPIRLLVLDEATSALDAEAERVVLDAIRALRGQMTVMMVAHRLSTLRESNLIFLLEHGRVVETGSWDQLIRPGSRFSDFWKLQSNGSPILT
jgi:ATP-binding cassette subfamily C protein